MSEERPGARPVPVPPSVRELIRKVAPEQEKVSEPRPERVFEVEGREWIARIAGEIAAGSDAKTPAYLVVVHFEPRQSTGSGEGRDRQGHRRGRRRGEGTKRQSLREALLPRGRFEFMYDEELVELFRTAKTL